MDDVTAALRSLRSTPGATFVILLTLSLAIGANTAIFSVVNGVLLNPFGYDDDSRLVVLWGSSDADPSERFRLSPADYRDVRDEAAAFDGQVVLYRYIGSTLTALDRPVRVGSLSVTPRVFRVLGASPATGALFTEEDETPGIKKVVLTHASWTRRFGSDPDIVGTVLELDSQPYTVVGVAERGFSFPPGNDEVELYFPMTLTDGILLDRNHRMFDAVARLAGDTTVDAARAELAAMGERLAREFPDTNEGWTLTARPYRDELLGELNQTLWVLAGAVLLVLLIACANVANLLIARSSASSREFAMRAALGARSRDLLRRSLVESALLGAAGTAGGFLLAIGGVRFLRTVVPADIPRGAAADIDVTVMLFTAGVSVGATILFGSLPALRAMAPDVLALLRPGRAQGASSPGGRRLRELMVVVELGLAIVLLVGAGLMMRSFSRLSEVDPGFRKQGVVSVAVSLPRSRYGRAELRPFYDRLVERVESLPGVTAAGAISDLPMSPVGLGFELEFTIPGLDAVSSADRANADFRLMLPGYFDAMGMDVLRGRDLNTSDASSPNVRAVVNETLVRRYFGDVDPIGRSIRVATLGETEIVGVVSDIRHQGLQSRYESEVYLSFGQPVSTSEMVVVAQSELETTEVAAAVSDVLLEMDPQLAPSRIAALEELLWESVARPRFMTALLSGLALSAILLAVMGTYGIVAYSVSRRRGEIGVRMALGADAASTVSLIVRDALRVVAGGALLGLVGAWGASRFLGQLLFDVAPTDPLTYGVVLSAALAIGCVAAWLPALRATQIDPVETLRDE